MGLEMHASSLAQAAEIAVHLLRLCAGKQGAPVGSIRPKQLAPTSSQERAIGAASLSGAELGIEQGGLQHAGVACGDHAGAGASWNLPLRGLAAV